MKVKLNHVRIDFPALFKPEKINGEGDPRFSAAFLFPPDHPCLKDIEAAIDQVAKEKWGTKADSVLQSLHSGRKICLHNGDKKAEYAGYSGSKSLFASNKARPLVIDRDRTALTAANGKLCAGCYVNATVDIWAMDNKFYKCINASLGGVQFCHADVAFTVGGMTSEKRF